MSAGQYNFTIEQNSDLEFNLAWVDSNKNPIDLTGASATLAVASTPPLNLTSGSGLTLGGTAGTVAVLSPAATTATLAAARGIPYTLTVTTNTGYTKRLLEGFANITAQVIG